MVMGVSAAVCRLLSTDVMSRATQQFCPDIFARARQLYSPELVSSNIFFMRTDQEFHTRGNILPFFRENLRMWGIWECDVASVCLGDLADGLKAASASERGG
jgi:hypothetical protein